MKWLLAACLVATATHAADMIELRYVDQDPGDAPYLTRVLVTPDFLRMDDGEAGGDFILLDRKHRRVTNVMAETRRGMQFSTGRVPAMPPRLKIMKHIEAVKPGTYRVRVSANGVQCSETVTARALHPEAQRALIELKTVLAATQYRTWINTPKELQRDCDLVNQVWTFRTAQERGLPMEERDFSGRTRQLESQRTLPVQDGLFKLPSGLTILNSP